MLSGPAKIGRRRTTALLGAAVLGATSRTARAADEVAFASYGGSIEQFLRKSIIPDFEKETGIRVTYVVGTALSLYSRVLATRNRPEIDVYWANDLTHTAGHQLGLYDRIDPAIVKNTGQLIAGAFPADGIGAQSQISSTSLEYNAEKFRQAGWAPPTSWFDLWDPKYKGKIAAYTINILYSQELLGVMTRLLGGTEADIGPALKKIKELRENGNIAVFANTPAEMDNIMAQGQAWLTYNGSIRTLLMKASGAPMELVNPKEGAVGFSLYLDLVKNAPHKAASLTFIDFMLRPDIQSRCAEGLFYAPTHKESVVRPELAAMIPHGPAAHAALIKLDRVVMNRDLDNWIEQWNKVIEAKP